MNAFGRSWQLRYLVGAIVIILFLIVLTGGNFSPSRQLAFGLNQLDLESMFQDGLLSVGLADCSYVKVPYNCKSVQVCDAEQCSGIMLFGNCVLGSMQKGACHVESQCSYNYEWDCPDPSPYTLTTTPASTTQQDIASNKCGYGYVWINNKCTLQYTSIGTNTTTTPKSTPSGSSSSSSSSNYLGKSACLGANGCIGRDLTTVAKTNRTVCGGNVVQNNYMMGTRFIQTQVVETTTTRICDYYNCSTYSADKALSVKSTEDCTQTCIGAYPLQVCNARAYVCSDTSGIAHCVRYPLEVQIDTFLGAVQSIFSPKA
jgi:hypothetical protein